MEQSQGPPATGAQRARPWLLLIHQVPAKPDYLRVKVWRRLRRLGAVAMKNSVWVLPHGAAALEDFHWLSQEIAADGGEALLCEASFLAGLTAAQQAALARLDESEGAGRAPGRVVPGSASPSPPSEAPAPAGHRNRTWVTRSGVHVDRIASAWLIRRWIDPAAQFRFVGDAGRAPTPGELRFDMFGGEFTHEGDRCTFEVLAGRFAPEDAVLAHIGRIVHDIDLKDGKYGLVETPGIARLIEGLCAREPSDVVRSERGAMLFDDLYAALGSDAWTPTAAPGARPDGMPDRPL